MCGISVCFVPEHRAESTIASMIGVLRHRGPDGSGVFTDSVGRGNRLALGHNRLSIIDLSDHASQPMRSEDGRFVLIYNGEVYNYREISRELGPGDLPEGAIGDTAVVLAALIKWGPAALAKFNGMWALALYDTAKQTLLVSRDRFGVARPPTSGSSDAKTKTGLGLTSGRARGCRSSCSSAGRWGRGRRGRRGPGGHRTGGTRPPRAPCRGWCRP